MSVIKLIISDIDGTILDQKHQLDSHLLELMPLLKQSEIPFDILRKSPFRFPGVPYQ